MSEQLNVILEFYQNNDRMIESVERINDSYLEMLDALEVLESENAKLRDELDQWHRLTAGIELPEYPITEFKPKDLERENAKLRELVRQSIYAMDGADWASIVSAAIDLGVEVDE